MRGRQTHGAERQLFRGENEGSWMLSTSRRLFTSCHTGMGVNPLLPDGFKKCSWNFHISFVSPPDTKTRDIIYRKTGEKKIEVCVVEIRWGISKWMLQSPNACYLCWDYLLSLAKQLCVLLNTLRPLIHTHLTLTYKDRLVYCLCKQKITQKSSHYLKRLNPDILKSAAHFLYHKTCCFKLHISNCQL